MLTSILTFRSGKMKRIASILVPVVMLAGSALLLYGCWVVRIPLVINDPYAQDGLFKLMAYITAPVIAFFLSLLATSAVWESDDNAHHRYADLLHRNMQSRIRSIEKKLNDPALRSVMQLLEYSREELQTYHEIGLAQSRKSYRNSMVAMWLGLLIMAAGITVYVMPLPHTNQNFVNGNLHILTVASGVFVEMVAALFFFMYRSTLRQLNFLYTRQHILLDSLICLQMAEKLQNREEITEQIIRNILGIHPDGGKIKSGILKPFAPVKKDHNAGLRKYLKI